MKLQRYDRNPIITPRPDREWECLVTTNPGAWYDDQRREVILLYRAAGADAEHVIHLARAVSPDGFNFERFDEPVVSPSRDGHDGGCVEDARIVKFGEHYFVTYASRFFAPGEYWREDDERLQPPVCPPDFPRALRENITSSGLLLSTDLRTFVRAGRMTDPTLDDRNVILFPEKISGQYAMLHRPMDWVGEKYGTPAPSIWLATGDDVLGLRNDRLLAKPRYPWEERKIGANTPPLRTRHGWLVLYHGVGTDSRYRVGAMLLDLHEPARVLHRTPEWILQPEAPYELDGPYVGCVFPCGQVVINGTLFVYYGAADRFVAVATCRLDDLVRHLLDCPD
ncbi:MAG: glycosidase [Phycisphaerales bacterium]|nr:glycosidase [Phycisphaerales bacterium]